MLVLRLTMKHGEMPGGRDKMHGMTRSVVKVKLVLPSTLLIIILLELVIVTRDLTSRSNS